jgi:hypothetical protein
VRGVTRRDLLKAIGVASVAGAVAPGIVDVTSADDGAVHTGERHLPLGAIVTLDGLTYGTLIASHGVVSEVRTRHGRTELWHTARLLVQA